MKSMLRRFRPIKCINIFIFLFLIASNIQAQDWIYAEYARMNDAQGRSIMILEYGIPTKGYNGKVKWKVKNLSNVAISDISINDKIYTLTDGTVKKLSGETMCNTLENGNSCETQSDGVNVVECQRQGVSCERLQNVTVVSPILSFKYEGQQGTSHWGDQPGGGYSQSAAGNNLYSGNAGASQSNNTSWADAMVEQRRIENEKQQERQRQQAQQQYDKSKFHQQHVEKVDAGYADRTATSSGITAEEKTQILLDQKVKESEIAHKKNQDYFLNNEKIRKQNEESAKKMEVLYQAADDVLNSYVAMKEQARQRAEEKEQLEWERKREEERERNREEAEEKRKQNLRDSYFPSLKATQWPKSYTSVNSNNIFFYIIQKGSTKVKISEVFAVGQKSDGSWPYQSDVIKQIHEELNGSSIYLIGYFTDFSLAKKQQKQAIERAVNSYLDVSSFLIKTEFSNKNQTSENTKGSNFEDVWNTNN